jgi:hypothetical protein
MRIEFQETVTLDDFAQAHKAHMRKITRTLYAILVVASVISWVFAWYNPVEIDKLFEIVFPTSIIITLGLVFYFEVGYYYDFVKKAYKKAGYADQELRVTIDDKQLTVIGPTSQATTQWDHFYKWRESQAVFMLYSQPTLMLIIPKRFMTPEQVDEFRTFLTQHCRQE